MICESGRREGKGWAGKSQESRRAASGFLGGISALDHLVAPNIGEIGHCHNAAYCFTLSGGKWRGFALRYVPYDPGPDPRRVAGGPVGLRMVNKHDISPRQQGSAQL